MTARYSLGIDIGGTFTDIVVFDHANGSQFARKVLTSQGIPVIFADDMAEATERVVAAARRGAA